MTISDILKNCNYADYEIYQAYENENFHTDNLIIDIDPGRLNLDHDFSDSEISFQLMTEADYSNSVLANACETADFAGWYGDSVAKVLVITIKQGAYIDELYDELAPDWDIVKLLKWDEGRGAYNADVFVVDLDGDETFINNLWLTPHDLKNCK